MNDHTRVMQHPKLGKVHFRKMLRSRSIRISIKPDEILVTLPLVENFTTAELFLYEKADWIIRMRSKSEATKTQFTPDTDFETYSRKVQLVPEARKNVRVQITPEMVFIYYPDNRSVDDEVLQSVIRKAVEHAWKVEAYEELPQRMEQLSAQIKLQYKALLIKNSRSYWGLCAPDNTITLNIHLMHLPLYLIDFIILHELCHTVHKNHGPKFWELLNTVTFGKAREYSREMRKYSTRVY